MVDDQLRLIFTCCHPALAVEAQVALTLRTVCGLTTEEIARGFLTPVATMAQRLVRVKRKIRDARLPFAMPPKDRLAERLDGVMLVVYLVFTEGYAATSGKVWIRRQLCEEAIRLGRLLCELIPRNPELRALLALMLLHDSRRMARARDLRKKSSRWRSRIASCGIGEEIAEGVPLLEAALREGASGEYALQAAIAALHARAKRARGYGLGADRALVRRVASKAAVAGGGIESSGCDCDGGGSAERAGVDRRSWRRKANWPDIICCRPRERICCGARVAGERRRKPTGRRWRWWRTIRSGAILTRRLAEVEGLQSANGAPLSIEPMRPEDWPAVRAIYLEGIATGNATFEQTAPEWEKWDAGHLPSGENRGAVRWRCFGMGCSERRIRAAAFMRAWPRSASTWRNAPEDAEWDGS